MNYTATSVHVTVKRLGSVCQCIFFTLIMLIAVVPAVEGSEFLLLVSCFGCIERKRVSAGMNVRRVTGERWLDTLGTTNSSRARVGVEVAYSFVCLP